MKTITYMNQILTDFHKSVRAANEAYNTEAARLESFKGSAGYDDSIRNLSGVRADAVAAAKATAFSKVADAEKQAINKIGSIETKKPTTDEVNVLSLLRMLNNPTAAQVSEAAKIVNSPLACEVLREVVKDHQIFGVTLPKAETSAADALAMVATAVRSMKDAISETVAGATTSDMMSRQAWGAYRMRNDFPDAKSFLMTAGCNNDPDAVAGVLAIVD